MKVIATVQADLAHTPLGTRSRLAHQIAGQPVLRRTVERIRRARRIEAVYVLCPVGQFERCQALLRGIDATVRKFDADPAPWASLVQTARKWSVDGWRGGIGGTTYFDEFTDLRLICGLLDTVGADAVMSFPAAAPLIDPALIDRMIAHQEEASGDIRMTFTQAPPGIAGVLFDAGLARELTEKNTPIGWLFAYKPDDPRKDLIFQPCCLEIPTELRHAVGRLTADTDRSLARVAALIAKHDTPDLATVGRWLTRFEANTIEPMPGEVEIELTTEDPYPGATLRPSGDSVPTRGLVEASVVRQIVKEVTRYDDALLVLGGFGDPLRHPHFVEMLQSIRSAQREGNPLYGLAVRTNAAELPDEHIEAMIEYGVDLLDVTLDAWTPALYSKLQSPDDPARADLDRVLQRLDRLTQLRQEHQTVKPIMIPRMTKARENVHELDDFYDGWLRRAGAVTISGYSHYGKQCEDRSVISMAPSPRIACRRLRSRCLVLADGRVAVCDQDFTGAQTVGRLGDQSLEQIWSGSAFAEVRDAHRQARFDLMPLCTACDEWHRP